MLYHISELLEQFNLPGHGLMGYLTFRAGLAFAISLLTSLIAGNRIIGFLQKKQIGETIRDLGLEGQLQKKGTPTMGGVIILLAILCSALLACDLTSIYTWLMIFATVWCGGIGFADDYIKVFKHNKEGMSERGKLVLQLVFGLVVAFTVCVSPSIRNVFTNGSLTEELVTTIPFFSGNEFDYSWLSPFSGQFGVYCTWAIYVIMIVIVIMACSNGANLTDGMDGLSAGTSAIVGVTIAILAWLSSSIVNADYLNIMFIPGSGEVAVFMAGFVGALIGFLWYNSFPAQVFMGDTGSLAIGGIIGVSAILIRKELILPILCGIFLAESLSVLMQRFYFKYTKKKYGAGRRIFRMSPLHHHFQKQGIDALIQHPSRPHPESKIVSRFLIVGMVLAAATLASLKIR